MVFCQNTFGIKKKNQKGVIQKVSSLRGGVRGSLKNEQKQTGGRGAGSQNEVL